jgi:hypothetical protein
MLRPSIILASLVFSPANVIVPDAGDVVIPPAAIVQVICIKGNDEYAGTAFRVGNGILLSVNHVTETGQCTINGAPISKWYRSPSSDFSMLHGDNGPFIKVDCGGFVKGRHYIALGYGRGVPIISQVDLIATGLTDRGEAVLEGILSVIPGQSGGPVVDSETGEVVGTVNAQDFEDGLSWSVELKTTPICKRGIA